MHLSTPSRAERLAEIATWATALIVACMPLASIIVQGQH